MRQDDPVAAREQYSSEKGLAARASLYDETTGPNPADVAFDAVAEVRPQRFLDIGCGTGAFTARVASELGSAVIAADQSLEMRDANGTVTISSREAIVRYFASAASWHAYADRVPNDLKLPLVARRSSVVFAAST